MTNGIGCGGEARSQRSLLLAGIALCALGSGCAGARRAEGRVLVARDGMLMLDERPARTFVALAPAASFTGIGALRELRAGDRVSYGWRVETAGVRIAERLDVAPVISNEPDFAYGDSEFELALQRGDPPALLDTRPRSEHRAGHLPGALSLPADAPDAEVAGALPADRSALVVVYGEGPRDGSPDEMARRLMAAGARRVRVLRAGVRGWTEADRWVEISPEDVRELPSGWLVVDVRPREVAAAASPAGSTWLSLGEFRWQEFEADRPLPRFLFVGADARDPAAAAFAERIRRLRSSGVHRPPVDLAVLAGGFEGWVRAGLPVERGGSLRTSVPYVKVARAEISPDEFERLWAAQGGDSARFLDVRQDSPSRAPWIARIPLAELPARMGELPRDREIVVFCTKGVSAHLAAELLRANGFRARFLRAPTVH